MSAHFLTGDVERFIISSWDESGLAVREQQALHRQNVLPYTKKADVLMVVYDMTNMQSFRYLPDIMQQIVSSGTMPWASLVLVGNKLDTDSLPGARKVTTDMAFDLCRKFGFGAFFETSARTGANVTEVLSVVLSRCEQDRLREMARLNPTLNLRQDSPLLSGTPNTSLGHDRGHYHSPMTQPSLESAYSGAPSARHHGSPYPQQQQYQQPYGTNEMASNQYAAHSRGGGVGAGSASAGLGFGQGRGLGPSAGLSTNLSSGLSPRPPPLSQPPGSPMSQPPIESLGLGNSDSQASMSGWRGHQSPSALQYQAHAPPMSQPTQQYTARGGGGYSTARVGGPPENQGRSAY
jgi:hypothetical protein